MKEFERLIGEGVFEVLLEALNALELIILFILLLNYLQSLEEIDLNQGHQHIEVELDYYLDRKQNFASQITIVRAKKDLVQLDHNFLVVYANLLV
jgi:hypothetical protein